jgi:hypothetical protein
MYLSLSMTKNDLSISKVGIFKDEEKKKGIKDSSASIFRLMIKLAHYLSYPRVHSSLFIGCFNIYLYLIAKKEKRRNLHFKNLIYICIIFVDLFGAIS